MTKHRRKKRRADMRREVLAMDAALAAKPRPWRVTVAPKAQVAVFDTSRVTLRPR